MERLIELLNEYDGHNHWWDYDEEYFTSGEFYEEDGDLEIISKKFGFIKWLVQNEKIETTKLQDYWDRWEMGIGVFGNMYKSDLVILTLSIQDNPIEFLVSILE